MKFRWATIAVFLLVVWSNPIHAEKPLHQRIDELIIAGAGDQGAPLSGDAEFLRRVYLDLAGRIPTRDEALAFLKDESPDKRARLIDRLLAGPEYPRRMTELFNVILMERRGENDEWTKFLRTAFESNKPWDQMARDLLHPDADNEEARGAAYFLTARLVSEGAMAAVDVPSLTRDVGRLLAGKDLQCAQCHDHLSIDDYKQKDFQGLHAIFMNIQARRDVQFPAVSEKLMAKKHEFMSVFIQEQEETGPVVPGKGEVEIEVFPEGEQFAVEPDKKKRIAGVPKFSPLSRLAEGLAAAENEVFTRNITNRLWFVMMGRGLVHPLDEHHSANPPSHPELLDVLASEFAAHKFDIKWLLREMALSETYQRTSVIPDGQESPPPEKFLLALEKRLSAEQLLWSTLQATGEMARYVPNASGQADDSAKAKDKPEANLKKLRDAFVKMYANPPAEPEVEFGPSVKGALFSLNNEELLALFQRRDGNLIDHLANLTDDGQVVDALFMTILSRPPDEADRQDVLQILKEHPDGDERIDALSQLAWALWASNEFSINH